MPINKIRSALKEVEEDFFLDTAEDKHLNILSDNLGQARPLAGFTDDLWRAIVRRVFRNALQVRVAFARLMDLLLGPQRRQVSYLNQNALQGYLRITCEDVSVFPQIGTLYIDKGSPSTEEKFTYCYINERDNYVYLVQDDSGNNYMVYDHGKYQPIRSSTLAFAINIESSTCTLANGFYFPANNPPVGSVDADWFTVMINRGGDTEELIQITSRSTNVLTFLTKPKYNHSVGESVEVALLDTSPVLPCDISSGVSHLIFHREVQDLIYEGTAEPACTQVRINDSSVNTNVQAGQWIYISECSDPDFIGRWRQISIVTPAIRVEVSVPFVSGKNVPTGTEYKVVEDEPIANTEGLPASDFTLVINRNSAATAEDFWVLDNDLTWGVLTLNTAANYEHKQNEEVEIAQILVDASNYCIYETEPRHVKIIICRDSLPDIWYRPSFILHEVVDDYAAANDITLTNNAVTSDTSITMDLSEIDYLLGEPPYSVSHRKYPNRIIHFQTVSEYQMIKRVEECAYLIAPVRALVSSPSYYDIGETKIYLDSIDGFMNQTFPFFLYLNRNIYNYSYNSTTTSASGSDTRLNDTNVTDTSLNGFYVIVYDSTAGTIVGERRVIREVSSGAYIEVTEPFSANVPINTKYLIVDNKSNDPSQMGIYMGTAEGTSTNIQIDDASIPATLEFGLAVTIVASSNAALIGLTRYIATVNVGVSIVLTGVFPAAVPVGTVFKVHNEEIVTVSSIDYFAKALNISALTMKHNLYDTKEFVEKYGDITLSFANVLRNNHTAGELFNVYYREHGTTDLQDLSPDFTGTLPITPGHYLVPRTGGGDLPTKYYTTLATSLSTVQPLAVIKIPRPEKLANPAYRTNTTITLDDTSYFPSAVTQMPFYVYVGYQHRNQEIALVTSNNTGTNTLTISGGLINNHDITRSGDEYVVLQVSYVHLQNASWAKPTDGDVIFDPGTRIAEEQTYASLDNNVLTFTPAVVFDYQHDGYHAPASMSDQASTCTVQLFNFNSDISNDGWDYPPYLSQSNLAYILRTMAANLFERVKAAGIEVDFILDDCPCE